MPSVVLSTDLNLSENQVWELRDRITAATVARRAFALWASTSVADVSLNDVGRGQRESDHHNCRTQADDYEQSSYELSHVNVPIEARRLLFSHLDRVLAMTLSTVRKTHRQPSRSKDQTKM